MKIPSVKKILVWAFLLQATSVPGGRAAVGHTQDVLETPFLRLQVFPALGHFEILDKQSGVTWKSNPVQARFGELRFKIGYQTQTAELKEGVLSTLPDGLQLEFYPSAADTGSWIRLNFECPGNGRTIEISYQASRALKIEAVRLLDQALWTSDDEQGFIVVPVREGLYIPADSGLTFRRDFDTSAYEGCHMNMLGVGKQGSAALIAWDDPYVAAEIRSTLPEDRQPAHQLLAPSLILRQSARRCRLEFLGHGDFGAIAGAYREWVQSRGDLITWDEKLRENPARNALFGAINFKLWSVLSRRMNEAGTREESVRLNWTFDEAAQVAEHLKRDLKLDHVLFTVGGWIHRGYDNQHPDIMPAAPECGGNEGLADCSARVQALGYLFCLHDNYQDMYRDAPSWDPDFLMRRPDGSLATGGRWAGGRAYLTCSRKAVELARRPQNLPAVKSLINPNAYFIDTTYAAGLMECFAPEHPLTRRDDMTWKKALSDYARETFGIFGSECGREWAIPNSDFFEGMSGVSGRAYHDADLEKSLGATEVPLFEMVYRDCIAIYGKYGYDYSRAAEYVLRHISLGRPLNYHNVPAHLYWKESGRRTRAQEEATAPSEPNPGLFVRADGGWAEGRCPFDRFLKNTYEILSPLYESTAQMILTRFDFLTPDRRVTRTVFESGPKKVTVLVNMSPAVYVGRSQSGEMIRLAPYGFLVEAPRFLAFHALDWNGLTYEAGPLFTVRSLDGHPLDSSSRIYVYHGFGDNRLRWRNRVVTVDKELVLEGTQQAQPKE